MEKLTKKELEILKYFLYPREDICRVFVISRSTVNTHLNNILKKLNARSRGEALIKCIKFKILDIADIHLVNTGFLDEFGNYKDSYELVDFRKE